MKHVNIEVVKLGFYILRNPHLTLNACHGLNGKNIVEKNFIIS